MRFQDDTTDQKNNEYVFSGQVLKARVIRTDDKPIRYKHNGKIIVVAPKHPMYDVIKWYGEYESL